jgi:DNA polymerase-3 subunit chi
MPALAMFYHLKSAGLEDTVTMILTRAIGQGWRVMLRSPDKSILDHLDGKLWLGPEDSFLPHGLQGGSHDADQPILLGSGINTNGAKGLFLLTGADVEQGELLGLERVWVLFDGQDMAAVQVARAQWTRLTGWGLAAQYWSDETGSWVKKVDKPAVQAG